MPNTFDWVEIKTRSARDTAHFYESLFGWKVIQRETADGFDVWIFDTGGEPRAENLRRGGILQRARELGGKVIAGKTRQGPAYRAYFADPSGNRWGLWEEKAVAEGETSDGS
jgi:predicted enzyme related to lactoylglutathione lyase